MAAAILALSLIAMTIAASATVWVFFDTGFEHNAPVVSAWGTRQASNGSAKCGLFINEVMADNDASVPGPNGTYPDWIELYNTDNEPVDLSGMYLTDDLAYPTKWQFPNETYISAGGYALIWSNGYVGEESLQLTFALKANGETIALFASDGETIIDTVVFGKQLRDVSTGRYPDGTAQWDYFAVPTPGAANIISPLPGPSLWPALLLMVSIVAIVATIIFLMRRGVRRQAG